jgi:hypothetical protein
MPIYLTPIRGSGDFPPNNINGGDLSEEKQHRMEGLEDRKTPIL